MAPDETPNPKRDEFGKFVKVSAPPLLGKSPLNSPEPPLIDVRVANPLTYFRLWLERFLKNSEISINIRIKPMAIISVAIAIAIILGGTGFSIGYFLFPR